MSDLDYYKNIYLELDTYLEFGKYQGEDVTTILEEDPDYIVWLMVQGVEVSDEVKRQLG